MKSSSLFLLALLTSAAPAFANVTVSSPGTGSEVTSPFNLSATAASCSNQPVAAMGYSLDNSSNTTVVYSKGVNASVTSSAGPHTLHVKAWGRSGASCVTNVAINVVPPAPVDPAPNQSVVVLAPGNHTSVTSPFQLTAQAPTCSGQTVAAMGYSFDSSADTTIVKGSGIASTVVSGTGAHTLHVKAWGNRGAVCVTDVVLAVTAPATAAVIPSNAVSVSSLQALSNWKADYDVATGSGGASGTMQLVTSPSRSGAARRFSTSYTNYGGERYYVSFGDDATSSNFLYDAWIYVDNSVSQIANIEMDLNQTMQNGETVIFGFQCDGWTGTWDYTANKGTPENPKDVWIHSNAPCNARKWAVNTWHHVQVSYSRDDSGNVTYKSVWLDDAEQDINATVPSAFALGWGPALLTNFQIDGSGVSGSPTAYLDNVTVYRW